MVFGTDPHTQRAQEHLDSGDPHRLRYACLELRLALERIAYQKLQLRLGDISSAEITAWQPRRVMDTLMELVDPHIALDAEIRMGQRPGGGDPATDTFTPIGRIKGIDPKLIGKHWQKLGSFLHMVKPAKKGERPKEPDAKKLATFIREVIAYVTEVTATAFDAHFSEKVSFKCGSCDQMIVRNAALLQDNIVVPCQNPECEESYVTHRKGEEFLFKRHQFEIECKTCHKTMHFPAKKLLKLPYDHSATATCECGAQHLVCWRLQYAPDPEME
jgi:hypothetical protein